MDAESVLRRRLAFFAALILLVWLPSLLGPFQFDDWNVIVEQPAVHSLATWWQSIPGIRPLLKLSYAANWLAAPDAVAFHFVNLLIHAANVWLLWQLLAAWPQLDRAAVGWVVLIFALHPVQTEAVTYISGRSMSLMALCWLAAAQCWLRGRQTAAVVLFAAALACRETAWSLPFVLLCWQRARGQGWLAALRALAPFWAVLAFAALAVLALPAYRQMLVQGLALRDPLANLALQVEALRYLITEPLLLLRNNIDPDLPASASIGVGWWITALALILMAGFGLRWLSRRPLLGLALLWPLLLLLPTNGLIARQDVASERHLYLALIGPAVLLVHLMRQCLTTRMATALLAALVLVLTLATARRIADYRSESTLWQATALRSPDKPRVWNNLGHAHLVEGRPDLALPALRRALALDPSYLRAELNLERAEAALGSGDAPVAATLKDQ